jgi:hypothetical protein
MPALATAHPQPSGPPTPEARAPEPRALPAPVRSTARRDWTALPEAAAILADCAANPPATRMVEIVDLSTWHARHYVGARVRRLNAIHRAEAAHPRPLRSRAPLRRLRRPLPPHCPECDRRRPPPRRPRPLRRLRRARTGGGGLATGGRAESGQAAGRRGHQGTYLHCARFHGISFEASHVPSGPADTPGRG